MGKIILYIAQSLDGYIADENGSFDFLNDYMDRNKITVIASS